MAKETGSNGLPEGRNVEAMVPADAGLERPVFGVWLTALVAAVAVWAFSIISWWLLFDPKWSPLHIYPQPGGAFIFWGILVVVWTAFNLELWPTGLGQPRTGILNLAVTVVLTLVVVIGLAYGWGQIDPSFSYSLPGGAGYGNGTFIVLMGFFFWSMIAVNWDHWPWTDHGLRQPLVGAAEFFVGLALSMLAFLILAYPNFSTWTGYRSIPMNLNTTLGWFYTAIVVLIFSAQFWDNWPWAIFRSRALRSFSSLILLFAVGTLLYFVFRAWLSIIVPSSIQSLPGYSLSAQVAAFGVCINSMSLTWGLIFKRWLGSWPYPNRPKVTAALLTVAAFLLGSAIYMIYTRWAGTQLLHEPALKGQYGGNPLLAMDWIILVLFWYAISFDLYGLVRRRLASPKIPESAGGAV